MDESLAIESVPLHGENEPAGPGGAVATAYIVSVRGVPNTEFKRRCLELGECQLCMDKEKR